MTGAIHESPMYLWAVWNSLRTAVMSSYTVISAPFTPKSQRFFAAPNPPGINTASN
jgi:hypothetical protein